MTTNQLYQTLAQQFPFISVVLYGAAQDEFVGIIQNVDSITTSLYDFGALKTDAERKLFLSLGEKWYFVGNHFNMYSKLLLLKK